MTTVNHFVHDCTNLNFMISTLEIALANIHRDVLVLMSTLEIDLANILRDVLVLLDVADVHQCSKVDFPYLLFLCAFFMTSFHSFSIVAFASGSNIAWNERSFLFELLGFPRHASLRDRYPESSEPHVTLDSQSSLIRTTFGVLLSSQVHT